MVINKKNQLIYKKLIGLLAKEGKKNKIKLLVDNVLNQVSKISGLSSIKILLMVFQRLNTFVEVKTVKIRRRTHMVPFPIKLNRRIYLIIKWIKLSLEANNKRVNLDQKLTEEILSLLKRRPSKLLNFKKDNNFHALRSRSNMHYRW